MHNVNCHFPSESIITSYLENRLPNMGGYLKERKIINIVANAFANTDLLYGQIKFAVMKTMKKNFHVSNSNLLPEDVIEAISLNLTKALEDLADGKEIQLRPKF